MHALRSRNEALHKWKYITHLHGIKYCTLDHRVVYLRALYASQSFVCSSRTQRCIKQGGGYIPSSRATLKTAAVVTHIYLHRCKSQIQRYAFVCIRSGGGFHVKWPSQKLKDLKVRKQDGFLWKRRGYNAYVSSVMCNDELRIVHVH